MGQGSAPLILRLPLLMVSQRTTILVVDDHANMRSSYTAFLEHSGFHALEAANGAEGIRLARERRPDVILMDLQMPVLDGLTAAAMLKGEPETSHIPVIALTAESLRSERDRARSVCDAYLSKPCPPQRILEEIQRWTGQRDSRPE